LGVCVWGGGESPASSSRGKKVCVEKRGDCCTASVGPLLDLYAITGRRTVLRPPKLCRDAWSAKTSGAAAAAVAAGCPWPSRCPVCCSLTTALTWTLVRVCWGTLQEREGSQAGETDSTWGGQQGPAVSAALAAPKEYE
jgi:hypothetical protein